MGRTLYLSFGVSLVEMVLGLLRFGFWFESRGEGMSGRASS